MINPKFQAHKLFVAEHLSVDESTYAMDFVNTSFSYLTDTKSKVLYRNMKEDKSILRVCLWLCKPFVEYNNAHVFNLTKSSISSTGLKIKKTSNLFINHF